MAFQVYAMLANGMGGIDWANLDLAAAMFAADCNREELMERLLVIKLHRPETPGSDGGAR